MKRKIAAIVAALSLFAVVPSFAETKATDKRNAFEFCYLSQYRLSEQKAYMEPVMKYNLPKQNMFYLHLLTHGICLPTVGSITLIC